MIYPRWLLHMATCKHCRLYRSNIIMPVDGCTCEVCEHKRKWRPWRGQYGEEYTDAR